jgi:hypothetical protein
MTFDRIKPKYSDKSSPGATFFSTTNHTLTALRLNPNFSSEKAAGNRLSYDKVMRQLRRNPVQNKMVYLCNILENDIRFT